MKRTKDDGRTPAIVTDTCVYPNYITAARIGGGHLIPPTHDPMTGERRPTKEDTMTTVELRLIAKRYARNELGHPKAEVLDHVWDTQVENTGLMLIRTKMQGYDIRITLVVKDYEVISETSAADFYRNAPHWKQVDRVWLNTKDGIATSRTVKGRMQVHGPNTCVACGSTTLRRPLNDKVYCPSCRDSWPEELQSPHER